MLERNSIFDMKLFKETYPFYDLVHEEQNIKWEFDIPEELRLNEVVITRDDSKIKQLENRIIECREWMQNNLFEPTKTTAL